MNTSTTDATSTAPTTGEDIGKITWPQVAAEPGKNAGELEGAGPHAYLAVTASGAEFQGHYEACHAGLSEKLRVSLEGNGVATVEAVLRLPGNGQNAWEKRSVSLVAHVRESWVGDVSRGALTRQEHGRHIIDAVVALALVPGQRTVSVVEEGLSVRDAAAVPRC